ncbi:MAG: TolB family protein [Stygiobacter sp.]
MKRLLIILTLVFNVVFSQTVKIVEDKPITALKEGKFYYPMISPDGKFLLMSKENRQGLWMKDLSNGRIKRITNASGAGLDPVFSFDGNEILFRENKIINGKIFSSLKSYNLKTQKVFLKEDNIRDLKFLKTTNNVSKSYLKQNEIAQIFTSASLSKTTSDDISVAVDMNKIILYQNGVKKYLSPAGDGYYIWPSVSPDKSKLLFTLAGKGTYVSDLQGNILKKIGYANFPSWSPDGNWIIFMKDLDNGEVIISSEIYIANVNTGKYFLLTENQNEISLYPTWGSSINEIYYHTDNGVIRKIKIQFEQ